MIIEIIAILLMIGLDQLTKYLVVLHLMPVGSAPLLPGVLGLLYVENDGMAFSMLSGNQLFLIVVTAAALIALCWWLFFKKHNSVLERISLCMIIAGGFGNLIDRVLHHYVVDFFEVQFMRFAVFNVADIFVTVGVCLLLVTFIADEVRESKKKKQAKNEKEDTVLVKQDADSAEEPDAQPKKPAEEQK